MTMFRRNGSPKQAIFKVFGRAALPLVLASFGAFCLLLAQPPGQLPWLAWLAFVPILIAVKRTSFLFAAVCALFGGGVFYSLAFQWVNAFHPLGLSIMTAVEAVFFFTLPLVAGKFFLRFRLVSLFAVPSIWVIFEYVKETWFLKFPFGIIGYTQYAQPRLIQIASVAGVLGLSWVVMFVNTALFQSADQILTDGFRQAKKAVIAYATVVSVLFIFLLLHGEIQFRQGACSAESRLEVGYAQTLFHPKIKWQDHSGEYLTTIAKMAEGLALQKPDLIVFPELTIERPLTLDSTIRLPHNADILNALSAAAKLNSTQVLYGAIELVREGEEIKKCNSVFLFSKNGDLSQLYRKRVLVPFGEYYPFGELFPQLKRYILEGTSAALLEPGRKSPLFEMTNKKGERLTFGVLICFESAVPDLARRYALQHADFLVNVTNDYWSLSTIAMYQHAAISAFRAVETGRPVVRVSNGGVSCYIDEWGRTSTALPLFQSGLMLSRTGFSADRKSTVYTDIGDWPAPGSAIVLGLCLGFSILRSVLGRRRDGRKRSKRG